MSIWTIYSTHKMEDPQKKEIYMQTIKYFNETILVIFSHKVMTPTQKIMKMKKTNLIFIISYLKVQIKFLRY